MTEVSAESIISNNDTDVRKSAEEMDEQRQKTTAYEYLCHLEETKIWMEACLHEELPPTTELEENFRNGIYLAKLANFMDPIGVPLKKIYDIEQRRYKIAGLQFRHTDNINLFITCMKKIQLPLTFQPETTDIYDKKNMPRVIYCIHALSTHLFKLGKAPQIQDLYGKVNFTDAEINAVKEELKKYGIQMPAFQKIGGLLTNNMAGDTAALHAAVIAINECLIEPLKLDELYESLSNTSARLKNIIYDHINIYYDILMIAKDVKKQAAINRSLNDSYIADAYDELLTQAEIQGHINNINCRCAYDKVLKSLNTGGDELLVALKNPNLKLENIMTSNVDLYQGILKILVNLWVADYVDVFCVPLYFWELKIDRIDSNADITMEDIRSSIRVLTAVGCITKAVDIGDPELVYQALKNPDTHVQGIDEYNKVKYYQALEQARFNNQNNDKKLCTILTYNDIQECIDYVNEQCCNDDEAINILRELNNAVKLNNRSNLIKALCSLHLKINKTISSNDVSLYLKLFHCCLDNKNNDASELWLDDIEYVVDTVDEQIKHVKSIIEILTNLNNAIESNNIIGTISCLQETGIKININEQKKYYKALKSLKNYKNINYHSCWISYVTEIGVECFLNLDDYNYTWDRPKNYESVSRFITIDDIEDIIKTTTAEEYNLPSGRIDEKLIIKLQAIARGYLLRMKISKRLMYFCDNIDKIIVIQSAWRGYLQRKLYANERISNNKMKKFKIKRTFNYYESNINKIIKIQALWRGYTARKAFHSLLKIDKIPFSDVRYFSGVLNLNSVDYEKDLQMSKLKNDVVQTIRHNQNLSQQLDNMDIKIALLIQNRITLQDVIAHGKNLENLTKEKTSRSRKNSTNDNSIIINKGLKSLTKDGRKMLENYQYLFYALQTNPDYLTKLLFSLPESKSNKFLENVILTLFNFGSNIREYLLLKLFGCSLEQEIMLKYQKPSEVVTGNPLVLKIVVNYSRQLNRQKSLRQILGPIIEKVLDDKTICIETNPVDIYKCWRNKLEMETGENQNLPYSVTHAQALSYQQVQERLTRGIKILRDTVTLFLNKITESRDLIPYSMLYMAKILYNTLVKKFPNSPEKDFLKVVGNLIYYHFINAAIVNPDAFDIITTPADRSLSNDQRRNLASIAKILQFAASKKGFEIFRSCCQIDDLEEHFNIHEYTEATLIHKPEIYMSVQEICDTHNLLLEYQYDIAPDPKDILHELLDDLESSPTVASLMGITEQPICDSTLIRLGKTEVCLVLTNKFQVPDTCSQSLNKLFIITKELLVSVLKYLSGNNLIDALELPSTKQQNILYNEQYKSSQLTFKLLHKNCMTLDDCKKQLKNYLYKLECGGLVSRNDGYQKIITAIAKDLCNRGKYRNIRNKELQTLRATRQRLQEKTKYYAEQVQYYNQYINTCLENLHTGKGSLRSIKLSKNNHENNHEKLKSKSTLKYSAIKLFEKGIVVELDGLTNGQFKNISFEITPTEQSGIFTIKAKFLGVQMEKIDIDIQKLLELQFEGRPIMDLYGRAKINVNLLLHLINRKFYGK
ncbi:hypothetical protein HCN44_001808 [Aphidius gifuensis]|uniref:Ras GTPase-activating-like protein IQGAP1 n=1 Tax=Aphidius gifuensis TaxID=684658 RepID=A0A834XUT0_APHGI|nr:hypothetical protein HCN44_001808 [Aphidius gifuensis]